MTFYSTVYQRAAPGFHNFYHGFLDTPLFLTAQWHRRKYLTFLWRLPSPRKPVLSRKVSNRKTSFSSQPPLSISKYLQKLSQHFKATDLCDVKGPPPPRGTKTVQHFLLYLIGAHVKWYKSLMLDLRHLPNKYDFAPTNLDLWSTL